MKAKLITIIKVIYAAMRLTVICFTGIIVVTKDMIKYKIRKDK